MSHELHFINGKAQMAYIREEGLPWHGLGTPMLPDLPLEEWIIQAGLDWNAEACPIAYTDSDGFSNPISNRFALVHGKTRDLIGMVSDSYKIVQPREIMEAYEEIAGAAGYKIKTAGNLKGGSKIWALADCGDEFCVGGGKSKDVIKRNILIATSFDGSTPTIVEPTTVRVVCQNTLSMAAGYNGERAKVRITHHSDFDPGSIRADLLASEDDMDKSWEQFKERAGILSKRKVTEKEAVEYFLKLFGKVDENGELNLETNASLKGKMSQVVEIYRNGQGQETASARGTAWGLVNAVTRWTDHERNTRTDASRIDSAFFGNGATVKDQAVEAALELAA